MNRDLILKSIDRVSSNNKSQFVDACRKVVNQLYPFDRKIEFENTILSKPNCFENINGPCARDANDNLILANEVSYDKGTLSCQQQVLLLHKASLGQYSYYEEVEERECFTCFTIAEVDMSKEDSQMWDIGMSFGQESIDGCMKTINDCYVNQERTKLLPKTDTMKLRLSNDIPIYVAPRKLSAFHKDVVKGTVHKLLGDAVIQPSCSEYASPIVLVKKKSGEYRMCVDYRALNKITLKDNYPLPSMDTCIESLREVKTVSQYWSGFHQLNMEGASVKFTAFVTPAGQYEYLRMPFGLKNGPSVFERFVTNIFRDMIDAGEIIIYIDDILIATKGDPEPP